MFQPASVLEMKKLGPLDEKVSSEFLQQDIALPQKFFEKKWFPFRKFLIFLVSFWDIEQFLCRFANFFSQVCQNTDLRVHRKETGKNYQRKFFTLSISDFQQNREAWFSKL